VSGRAGTDPSQHARTEAWTYLVNLTASVAPVAGGVWGASFEKQQLQELAGLTANSDSTVIVQARTIQNGKPWVEEYEMSHGQINFKKAHESAGFGEDLTDLIAQAPAGGKLALINQAHGGGSEGLTADLAGTKGESLTLDQFEKAVGNGLEKSGHKSLDFLSLDSCIMANGQAMVTLAPLAGTIVASELPEEAMSAKADGQPLYEFLSSVLKTPVATGKDAAEVMLAQATQVCNDLRAEHKMCGTPDLGIYNTANAPQFEQSFKSFAGALSTAIEDGGNKQAVRNLIEELPTMSRSNERDIGAFAHGLLKGLDNGTIRDDANHSLRDATENLLQSNANMLSKRYEQPNTELSNEASGLSVYLPGQYLQPKEIAARTLQTTQQELNGLAKLPQDPDANPDLKTGQQLLYLMSVYDAAALRRCYKEFQSAGSLISPAVLKSLSRVQLDLKELNAQSNMTKSMIAKVATDAKEAQEILASNKEQVAAGLLAETNKGVEGDIQLHVSSMKDSDWGRLVNQLLDIKPDQTS